MFTSDSVKTRRLHNGGITPSPDIKPYHYALMRCLTVLEIRQRTGVVEENRGHGVLFESGINFVKVANEAAFYGPKIDVQISSEGDPSVLDLLLRQAHFCQIDAGLAFV